MGLFIVIVFIVILFLARPFIERFIAPLLRVRRAAIRRDARQRRVIKPYDESGGSAVNLKKQHDAKRERHMTNLDSEDFSHKVQVLGEVDYLQGHPTKLNTSYFNDYFQRYLDCFLWLDNQPVLDDEVILNEINKALDTYNYLALTQFKGRTGLAIKSAFLCALVSGSNNNIRSAYMRGKNTARDKRFVAKHTDQEYSDYMHDQYPILTMAIKEIEPERQVSIVSTVGYILYGEHY